MLSSEVMLIHKINKNSPTDDEEEDLCLAQEKIY